MITGDRRYDGESSISQYTASRVAEMYGVHAPFATTSIGRGDTRLTRVLEDARYENYDGPLWGMGPTPVTYTLELPVSKTYVDRMWGGEQG